jgi:cytochrome d ubiquinol oxidase subunit I
MQPGEVRATFEEFRRSGLCLSAAALRRRSAQATPEQIAQAAEDTVPTVWPLFWAFRVMVGLGFAFIGVMAYFFYRSSFKGQTYPRWALWAAVRDPDAVDRRRDGLVRGRIRSPALDRGWRLPTALSASHLSVADLLITLAGFMLFLLDPLRRRDRV